MSEQSTGFIGLGRMGRPMAMRLLEAGHSLAVFNRSTDKLEPFRTGGAVVAASPAEVAAASGIVFLCLSDTEAVENVVFDRNGVAAGGAAGKLLVDCSSIPPDATREMAQRLHEACGMSWVDAPVSGGVPGAEQGRLIFMCGGEAADVERAGPLFARLGRQATRMGPVGSGQMAKLCNQAIVSCNLAVIAETMNLARAAGVDVARLPEALAGGFADSLPLQIYGPRMAGVLGGEAMGDISTMLKDVDNVLIQARAAAVPMPVSAMVADRYQLLADRGYGSEDLDRLMRLFEPDFL